MRENQPAAEAEVSGGEAPPEIGHGAMRIWLIVGLFLVGINLRPAISSLAPVLGTVRSGTGLSSSGAGLLPTLPVLCFGLFAPFAPRLARRLPAEHVVLIGLLALAGGIGLRSSAGIAALFAGTLIAGASISVVMVLLPGIIKRDFSDRVGSMMGLYTMALCLGAALAAGATVPIQKLAGGDWRPALAFWLLPALIAALVWWPQLKHASRRAEPGRFVVRGLLSDALAWQVTFYMGMQSGLAYCVFGWLPTMLIDRGMAPLEAGFVLSVSIMVQLVTALGGPWLAARGKDQRASITLMMAATLAGFLGCVYAPLHAIWPWAVLLGLGQGGAFSIALTLIVLRAQNTHVAAALSGMSQGFGYAMAAAVPFVVGVLHDAFRGWHAVAILFAAVTAAALIAGLGAGRNRHVSARTDRID